MNSFTAKPPATLDFYGQINEQMVSILKELTLQSASESKKTGFSDLPYELRKEIYLLTLPEARVLHVTRKSQYKPIRRGRVTTQGPTAPSSDHYTVTSASYGIHHPAALSINNESRDIALSKLTKIFGVYWNIDIDAPYFEIKDNAADDVDLLPELKKAGLLDPFKNIAIDRMLWKWDRETASMEFKCTMGNKFNGYEHPTVTLRDLPNMKKCAIVYTEHTLQSDVAEPYKAWTLGLPTEETTMFHVGKMRPITNWDDTLEQTVSRIEDEIEKRAGWCMMQAGIEFEVMSIHGRERGPSCGAIKRGLAGWEMDWFG